MIKTKNQFFKAELKHTFRPERWYRLAQTKILNNMERGGLLYRSTHPNEKFWSFQLDWNEIQNIDEKCFLFFFSFFFSPPFPLLISFPFSFLKSNQRKGKSQRLKLCFFMCHSHWFLTILLRGELLGSLFYTVRYGKLLMESCCFGMGTSKSILRDKFNSCHQTRNWCSAF